MSAELSANAGAARAGQAGKKAPTRGRRGGRAGAAKAGAAAEEDGAKDEGEATAARARAKTFSADVDNIRTVFKEMDLNGDGALDLSEVADFCKKLGLVLSDEETTQALAEMELDASEDGEALGLHVSGSRGRAPHSP